MKSVLLSGMGHPGPLAPGYRKWCGLPHLVHLPLYARKFNTFCVCGVNRCALGLVWLLFLGPSREDCSTPVVFGAGSVLSTRMICLVTSLNDSVGWCELSSLASSKTYEIIFANDGQVAFMCWTVVACLGDLFSARQNASRLSLSGIMFFVSISYSLDICE